MNFNPPSPLVAGLGGVLSHQKTLIGGVAMWRELFVAGKPNLYEFHTAYVNAKFQGQSFLIESSSKRIDRFLNHLYEIEPKLIEKFVERVEINEERPAMWGYIYVSEELAKCITNALWERYVDLISATDIITAKLEYNIECLKKLAKKL